MRGIPRSNTINWNVPELKELYLEKELSISQTAKQLGYAYGAVHDALAFPRRLALQSFKRSVLCSMKKPP